MLEQIMIFTRGGLILWTFKELGIALKGSPFDTLIKCCLLGDQSGASSYNYDVPSGPSYTLKWTFNNDLGLVFAAVYPRILRLLYVDDLLEMLKQEFSKVYEPKRMVYNDFDDIFQQLKKESEDRAEKARKPKQPAQVGAGIGNVGIGKGVGAATDEGKQKKSDEEDKDGKKSKLNALVDGRSNGDLAAKVEVDANGDGNRSSSTMAFDRDRLKKLRGGGGKAAKRVPKYPKEALKKAPRVWNDSQPLSQKELDFSTDHDPVSENVPAFHMDHGGESMMDKEEIEAEETEKDSKTTETKKNSGWFSTMFNFVVGKASLDKADLEPALKALKDRLIAKNVAQEIADKICDSVAASLEGKTLASFNRISSTVEAAMEEAIVRVLTPRRSIDILRDVYAAKDQGKPYVMAFVGVNGVGKSTNLAKVAYWLQQHNVRVMIAACDTFRAGAVEQLRIHACKLQIPIFEKGYEKDPAVVAKEAIREATRNGSDVVLVDTAGRMQNNEPLMRALSKLVYVNNPDLILFVGEALVGNDGVDQLSKFSQKLGELSPSRDNPRLIDGILLTKFDAIDDKVGAALSMTYVSGAPIMFIGCGQSYANLKKLNAKSIVKSLLK
ncbi:OLC1v1023945C1 [Oldenlandia corymbosa var. corymbosa]|uniref:OLC1v1023945C1 n=1 Tax=Oldenlandia corymbosa var. corymbosa TaxID=529605 RepID=A0AAV1C1C3_OLDCO|nr:OLC1v1023945C1 [Oldenlandia corymbosa var. corymbosa]